MLSLNKLFENKYFQASVTSTLLICIVFFDYIFLNRSFISETDIGLTYSYRFGASEAIKSIENIPLWNPLTMTGTSWIGQDVQGNIFHVFNIFFLLFDNPVCAYMFGLILYYFVALFFSYLVFIEIFSFSIMASVLSVSVYAFTPELNGATIASLFTLGTFVGIPVLIIIINQFINTRKSVNIIIAAIITSIGYYSSTILNLQSLLLLFFLFLITLQYIKMGVINYKYSIKIFLLYFILTILFCSPILIPSIFETFDSVRSRIVNPGIDISIFIKWLLSHLLAPIDYLRFRSFENMHYVYFAQSIWPKWFPIFSATYYSIIPIISIIGFRKFIDEKTYKILLIFLAIPFVLAVIQGLPILWDLISKLTGGHGLVRTLRNLIIFASAGLSGFLINEVYSKKIIFKGVEKNILILVLLISIITLIFTLTLYTSISLLFNTYYNELINFVQNEELKDLLGKFFIKINTNLSNPNSNQLIIVINNIVNIFSKTGLVKLVIISINKIILFVCIIIFLLKYKKTKIIVFIIVLTVITDITINQKYIGRGNNLINEHIYNTKSKEHVFLKSLNLSNRTAVYFPTDIEIIKKFEYNKNPIPFPQPHRFYPLMGNFQLPYLVPSYSTYISTIYKGLAKLHENISSNTKNTKNIPFPRFVDSEILLYDLNNDIIDYLGIQYIFSPVQLDHKKLKLILLGDYYFIYENTIAQGRFDFVHKDQASIKENNIYYRPFNKMKNNNNESFVINNLNYSFNKISFDITNNYDGILILKDTYNKWWNAKVNGNNSEILLVNDVFRGVVLNKGINKVIFNFKPTPFYIGILLLVIGIVCVGVIFKYDIIEKINSD